MMAVAFWWQIAPYVDARKENSFDVASSSTRAGCLLFDPASFTRPGLIGSQTDNLPVSLEPTF